MTDHNREEREALIEEHRGVIAAFGDMSPIGNLARRTIRALEVVFEQAHTPTDDERTRVEQSNEVAGIVFDQVKKAWPDLHPVLDLRYGIADALWAAGFRRTVQGEPADAQVLAALNAKWNYDPPYHELADWSDESISQMRAALRAAAAVREEGQGR